MELDPRTIPWEEGYRLLIGAIVPRPIAWVSSISPGGVRNVAPFSFSNAFGANPMILGFATMRLEDGGRKDTLHNVEATREFVVNVPDETTLPLMDESGYAFPPEVDEFDAVGLTPVPSTLVAPPRIGEAPIAFECRVHTIVPFGEAPGASSLILGEVVYLHVADRVLEDGKIVAERLRPVARLGGPVYARPEPLPYRRKHRGR